jgi:hypothetical protein
MSEHASRSRRVTTPSATKRDARAAVLGGCERRKSRAGVLRRNEQTRLSSASDDLAGFPSAMREQLFQGLQASEIARRRSEER